MAESELDTLLDEHGDFDAVVAALVARAEAAEDEDGKAAAWRLIATVEAEYREDAAAAAEAFEHVLEAAPGDGPALEALAGLYAKLEDWEALAHVLVDQSATVEDPADRSDLLRRAAALYTDRLEQPEGAQLVLRKALVEAPLDRVNWAAVEELWTRLGAHGELADVLNEHASRVAAAQGEKASVPLLVAVARAHAAAGSAVLAEAFLSRAALLDEDDEEILRAQVTAQEAAEHWDALAESLDRLADRVGDHAEEAVLRRRVGRLRFEQLDDVDGAIRAFERAHQVHRESDDADTLGALYEVTGRYDALVRLLRETAESGAEPGDRLQALIRIAELQRDRLGDPAAARRSYEDALAIDPHDGDALSGLGALLEALGAWQDLADHLRRHAAAATESERPTLLLRRAEIQEKSLEDPAAAVATLQELQALDDTVEGCLTNLLRLLESLGRTSDAVAVHERLAELADGDEGWREHMMAAAAGHRELADIEEATAAYQAVLRRAPQDTAALAALEAVRTEAGDVEGAVASLRQQVEVAEEPAVAKALLLRLANMEKAGDPAAAAASFRRVLDIDPTHATALAALADCCEALEDWKGMADALARRIEAEREFVPKAALLARAAALKSERLDDPAGARIALEEAVELDPSCLAAARPLAAIFIGEGAWERARPLLEKLVAAVGTETPPGERHQLYRDLAIACDHLGLSDAAVEHFEAALDLEPADVPTMQALARLYDDKGRAADAHRMTRLLISEFIEDVPTDQHLDLFLRAGRNAARQGETERARELFERALTIDAANAAALRALAELAGDDGDTGQRVRAMRSLLELASDPKERVRLLLDIGHAHVEQGDTDAAASTYREALAIEPRSKAVLHALLAAYTSAERWEGAAETLTALVDVEEDMARRDKFLFAVGAIYRDNLGDFERAAGAFGRLLDADPMRPDAFDATQEMLAGAGEWKRLEEEYRSQLRRLAERTDAADARFAIVCALATLYRDRLDRPDDALGALRVAAELRPRDLGVRIAIAETFPRQGKSDDELIADHRAIVDIEPDLETSHQVLFDAFRRQRRFDEAWNQASILTVLGSRDPAATSFYAELRPASVIEPRRALGRSDWRVLQHPDLSEEATRLLSAIANTMRRVYSVELKSLGLNRKRDTLDARHAPVVDNLVRYCAPVLGVAVPELYRWGGRGLQNANFEPRALLVGLDMVSVPNDRRATFRVARAMCLMRNEFYLASAVTPPTLVALVQASIATFTGGIPQAWDTAGVRAWVTAIRDQPRELLQVLGEAVGAYLKSGQNLNLGAWPRAVELTAGRVALLLCGDLQRAAQACSDVATPLGEVDAHERILDLVRFASSAEYAELRAELGIGVGQG